MTGVEQVEIVVAHNERATIRVGDIFLKIDADQSRTDVELEAMELAPIPTPAVLWRNPPVLALAPLPGSALGHLGEPIDSDVLICSDHPQAIEMHAAMLSGGVQSLANWWHDHQDVPRVALVNRAMEFCWVGIERLRAVSAQS